MEFLVKNVRNVIRPEVKDKWLAMFPVWKVRLPAPYVRLEDTREPSTCEQTRATEPQPQPYFFF
jgi:hypothetical protein